MPALVHLWKVPSWHCRIVSRCSVRYLRALAGGTSHQLIERRVTPRAQADSAAAHSMAQADTARPPQPKMTANFCRMCGGRLEMQIPAGDDHWRHVCTSCGYIDFINPKMVVGCIVEHEGKLLLCRRAIQPCHGKWTVPAGFLELDESTAEGAARETWEEARARVTILAPYAHYDIPRIGQAYLLFRAALAEPFSFSAGPESLEVQLVAPEDIQWEEIAFSSISLALRAYISDMQNGRQWHSHHAVIDKKAGSPPNDPNSYVLRDHHELLIGDNLRSRI